MMTQDLFRHLRTHTKKSTHEDLPSPQMKTLDGRQQLLVVTMEECGELVQSCSKLLRRAELYSDDRYVQDLKDEVGDVYTMIDLLVEWDVLSWEEIENRREIKRKKLSRWSELIEGEEIVKSHEC